MLRSLVRGVKRRPYMHGLVRLCWEGLLEVTCVESEVRVVRAWLVEHGGKSVDVDMPVPEYTRRPWNRLYRWTLAAAEAHERAGGKWAPEPPLAGGDPPRAA